MSIAANSTFLCALILSYTCYALCKIIKNIKTGKYFYY